MSNNIPGFGNLSAAADPIQQDSLLIVQRGNDTYAVQLSDVYGGIVDYYLASNNIRSMAYENSGEYCPVKHDHDCYTYSECSSVPFSGYDGKTHIATFKGTQLHIPNQYVDHSEERADVLKKLAPKIGTLKFFSRSDFPIVDITSPEFEGWVRPDGKTYNLSDFKLSAELALVYGGSSDTFTVPTVDRFLRIVTSGGMSAVAGRNAVGTHLHTMKYNAGEITMQSVGDVTVDKPITCISTSGGNTPPFAIHHGYGNPDSSKQLHDEYKERSQKAYQKFQNMVVPGCNTPAQLESPLGLPTGETYPPYDAVPVLVYIGKSRYSQNEYIR